MKGKFVGKIIGLTALCALTYGVSAVEMKQEDIPNNTYVIGKYTFDRNSCEARGYEGVLTTPHIMMASKSITGNKLDNMTIYYKNARGNWINGISGESVEPKKIYDVIYTNMDATLNTKDMSYLDNSYEMITVSDNEIERDVIEFGYDKISAFIFAGERTENELEADCEYEGKLYKWTAAAGNSAAYTVDQVNNIVAFEPNSGFEDFKFKCENGKLTIFGSTDNGWDTEGDELTVIDNTTSKMADMSYLNQSFEKYDENGDGEVLKTILKICNNKVTIDIQSGDTQIPQEGETATFEYNGQKYYVVDEQNRVYDNIDLDIRSNIVTVMDGDNTYVLKFNYKDGQLLLKEAAVGNREDFDFIFIFEDEGDLFLSTESIAKNLKDISYLGNSYEMIKVSGTRLDRTILEISRDEIGTFCYIGELTEDVLEADYEYQGKLYQWTGFGGNSVPCNIDYVNNKVEGDQDISAEFGCEGGKITIISSSNFSELKVGDEFTVIDKTSPKIADASFVNHTFEKYDFDNDNGYAKKNEITISNYGITIFHAEGPEMSDGSAYGRGFEYNGKMYDDCMGYYQEINEYQVDLVNSIITIYEEGNIFAEIKFNYKDGKFAIKSDNEMIVNGTYDLI